MKRFVSFLIVLIMCLSLSTVAIAESIQSEESVISTNIVDEPARAEETIWYFRTYNGRAQMRLWSLTYGKWLTDWIDIGPISG